MSGEFVITRLSRCPGRAEEVRQLSTSSWPEFLRHADVRQWSSLFTGLADFQIVILEDGILVAAGLTVPCAWYPGHPLPESIDEVVFNARWPLTTDRGVLCAMAALVVPAERRRGLSRRILHAMIDLAGELKLEGVLAPVRPTRKHEVPDEPVDEYINRRNDNGGLWDPWLRVHEDIGGKCLGIAETALTVNGKISEWETWCQMRFPQAGKYSIPGGLVPVVIDRGTDSGTYIEPNVWYFHQSVRR